MWKINIFFKATSFLASASLSFLCVSINSCLWQADTVCECGERKRACEAAGDTVHALCCCWAKSHNCTYTFKHTHTQHTKDRLFRSSWPIFLLQALRQLAPPEICCFSITLLLQGLLLANGPAEVSRGRAKREMEKRKWEVRSEEA